MASPITIPRGAWFVVALLWVVALFNYLDRNIIATLHGPITADIPMTEAHFGLLTSAFLWVYALASPGCGFLADRFSRRTVIFASLLIWSIVTGLTGQMHTVAGLLWTRAAMGVSEACFLPAGLALICDYHRGATRSRATALLNTGTYAGAALSGLGGYFALIGGWRIGYTILGVAGAGYALILIIFLREAPRHTSAAEIPAGRPVMMGTALRELFGRPAFWVLEILHALTSVANWTIYAWMPTFLAERFHLASGPAGISATSCLQITSLVSVLASGACADAWSRKNPRGRMLVPAIGLCLAAPGLWFVGTSAQLGVVLGGIGLYGVGRGCYDANIMPMLRQVADERYSATGYGFLNCVGTLCGGVMAYAGGALRDAQVGLEIVFRGCGVGILASALLLFWLKPRRAVAA